MIPIVSYNFEGKTKYFNLSRDLAQPTITFAAINSHNEFESSYNGEDQDWSDYETMGYWGIEDESYRDAFDDDPEAYWNID